MWAGNFTAHQVQGLDAVGALVDHGDARVASVLLHSVVTNVTMAAIHLHGHLRHIVAYFGEIGLDEWCQQLNKVVCFFTCLWIFAVIAHIDLARNPRGERPRPFGKCPHGEEHTADVGVYHDRVCRLLRGTGYHRGRAPAAARGVVDRRLVGADPKVPGPWMPTPRRASFIMVNMARMPLCGSPTSQPIAPSKLITQVADALMPILSSMPAQVTGFRSPAHHLRWAGTWAPGTG